jgi:hypothetical protein
MRQASILAEEIIENLQGDSPADYAGIAVAMAARFDVNSAVEFASAAFVQSMPDISSDASLKVFDRYLEIILSSAIS